MNEPYLNITPLGGLGEIGLNCQLWETAGGVVMVDCGLMFPDDAHLGVDVVIPHFGAVSAIKDKLLGIVLTHGHEDHIGALPWIVPELKGTRIYGSRFTLALVEHKLREREILDWVELCPVDINTVLPLGDLTFRFFPVCHSIPEGFGLGVETPVGRVVHSGDFKIDPHPLDTTGTDLNLFRNFAGPEGARLLLSDSTNVVRDGRSLTEREVKDSLDKIFAKAEGRIVITLFSSHIQRIQEVFDLAREHGRTVVISGKSLANNIEMARDLGIAKLPPSFFNAHNGVPDLPDNQLVLVVTGAQGEPLSALSRMVLGGHRQLEIRKGDTVVMSSRMIPGNAKAISKLINEMYRIGAEVLYESVHTIHASGHAQREELRDMLGGMFGQASAKVVIEEFLSGVECSVFVLTDGKHYQILPEAKDYKRIGEHDITNIRILQHDAVEVLAHMLPEGSLQGIHVFFPDPWHKKKHNKRRLIQAPFLAKLVNRLAPGGYIHCATDWEPYAQQMLEVLSAEPQLRNSTDGFAPRPDYRPLTKFEQRGLRLGHGVWDVIFRKRA